MTEITPPLIVIVVIVLAAVITVIVVGTAVIELQEMITFVIME